MEGLHPDGKPLVGAHVGIQLGKHTGLHTSLITLVLHTGGVQEGMHPDGKQLVDRQVEGLHPEGKKLVGVAQLKPDPTEPQPMQLTQVQLPNPPIIAQEIFPPMQHKKFPALQAIFEMVQGRFIIPQICPGRAPILPISPRVLQPVT